MATRAPVDPPEVTSPETASAPETPRKSRKQRWLVSGGLVGPIALAWMLSLVALPSKEAKTQRHLDGPFVAHVSPSNGFQVNLADRGSKHYLAMNLKVGVDAYDESYVKERSNHPLYQAQLSDAVLKVASRKTKDQLDDLVEKEAFREELRAAIDAVIFPLHVGNEQDSDGRHARSGLRPGISMPRATFRGLFHEHVLHVDAAAKTVQLDDGPLARFAGDESDLRVDDAEGGCIFLDVTGLREGFRGEVPVGMLGRVREVYFSSLLTQ